MSISNYKEIQELRRLAIEEIASKSVNVTVEHLKLAEMHVQTVIMASLGPREVSKEEPQWRRK